MQSVLGLSVTSTSVGWVLLDGQGSDPAILDHDVFDVQSAVNGADAATAPHTAAARGAQAIAAASGHKVGSVHVTWTQEVDAGSAALLNSLADLGFDDVHAVPVNRAAQFWGIETGRGSEHAKTGLCILEPNAATMMVIATGAGTVRTAITDHLESAEDVVEWLRTVFRKDGWLPESLYLIGAHTDLDELTQPVADALPIPVSDSVDSQLALARGAALATVEPVVSSSVQEVPPEKPWRITRAKKEVAPAAEPLVDNEVTRVIATPRAEPEKRDRPWILAHAKKLTIGAAAVAVFGAALSLAAGSALNVETDTAQAADTADLGASVTSASVHPMPAQATTLPVPALQPLAAAPPAGPPPAPETLSVPAAQAAITTPESTAAPVPHPTPEAVAVPAPHPTPSAVPSTPVPVTAPVSTSPEATPLAAPVVPPPAAPVPDPPVAAPGPLVAGAPEVIPPAFGPPPGPVGPAAPGPVVPAAPADGGQPQPLPPDPVQQALSPLFSGLP